MRLDGVYLVTTQLVMNLNFFFSLGMGEQKLRGIHKFIETMMENQNKVKNIQKLMNFFKKKPLFFMQKEKKKGEIKWEKNVKSIFYFSKLFLSYRLLYFFVS